ncbi:MAG: hypothetical protein JW894_00595 [Bacteroidales bacterium]|nr:hypothetical protein [Bacteroidales bacterium]
MDSQLVKLNPDQIRFIEDDVRKAGIGFSHLETDLIDHICCYVEELMDIGNSFEDAYKKVKKEIGYNNLKYIEIKTILLITKKFETMKTFMKITGISGISLFLISLIFKMNHLAGANVLFLLGVICIAFAYIPSLLITVKKEKLIKRNIHVFYSAAVTVFLFLITYIFTVMHWPYKSYMILLIWISTFVFILLLFFSAIKIQENRIINLSAVLILTIIVALNIFSYSITDRNSQNEIRVLEYNLKESNEYFSHKTEELKHQFKTKIDDSVNPDNYKDLVNRTEAILNQLESFNNKLFPDERKLHNYNKSILKPYIKKGSIQDEAINLEVSVRAYQESILDFTNKYNITTLDQYIRRSVIFSQIDFNQNSVVVYNNIQRLQRDIRILESEILGEILRKSDS